MMSFPKRRAVTATSLALLVSTTALGAPGAPAPAATPPTASAPPRAASPAASSAPAAAATLAAETAPPPTPARYSLAQCLELAARNHPLMAAKTHDLAAARARRDAVAGRAWPKVSSLLLTGGTPEARGDAVETTTPADDPDRLFDDLGPFVRVQLTIEQPLWTFGKLDSAKQALASLATREQAAAVTLAWQVRTQVKTLYNAWLLIEQSLALLREVRVEADKAQRYLDERLEAEDPAVSPLDRLKLRVFVAEVESRTYEAEARLVTTRDALSRLVGLSGEGWQPAESELSPVALTAPSRSQAVEWASSGRSELAEVDAGIAALRAKGELAQARRYPDLFVAGSFRYGIAPNRDDQDSPFARDDFNFLEAGVALGARFDFQPTVTSGEIAEARAELASAVEKREALSEHIRHGATAAVAELEKASGRLRVSESALRAARAWSAAAVEGLRMGTRSAKDAVDGLEAYIRTRFARLEAIYAYNKAAAELSAAVGRELQEDLPYDEE